MAYCSNEVREQNVWETILSIIIIIFVIVIVIIIIIVIYCFFLPRANRSFEGWSTAAC